MPYTRTHLFPSLAPVGYGGVDTIHPVRFDTLVEVERLSPTRLPAVGEIHHMLLDVR